MRVRHALTGATYRTSEDGLVEVELDGRSGVFRTDGRWVRGELCTADPHLLLWLASRMPDPREKGGGSATSSESSVG